MKWVNLIADFMVSIANAWPIWGLVIILIFRKPLKKLISKIVKGPLGLEFDNNKQQIISVEDLTKSVNQLKLASVPDYVVSKDLEKQMSEEVIKISEKEKIPILIKFLIAARLSALFERIYGLIFNSQIQFLRKFVNIEKMQVTEAKRFFEEYQTKHFEFYKNIKFEDWVDFLQKSYFISLREQEFHLTDLGKDFIKYLEFNLLAQKEFG